MEIRIEEFASRTTVCVRRTGAYAQSAPEAWDALWTWVHNQGRSDNVKRKIGFGLDNPAATAPEHCRYEACIELHGEMTADDAAGVKVQTVPGGVYAVHRMEGAYTQMPERFQAMRNDVLPEKGLTIDPFRPFLEIYVSTGGEDQDALTDLCIPIEI